VSEIHNLVEDLIDIRSKFQHHLKAIQAEKSAADAQVQAVSDRTVAQLKKWIEEINGMLKSYAATSV
jgi:hypothetical protein